MRIMEIKYGTTRCVILTKKYAFKFPRFVKYSSFLYGLLANIGEVRLSKMKDERLCPIFFNFPFGFFVIMPRCEEISRIEYRKVIKSEFRMKPFNIPVESKIDSFGKYKGKIVAIDYGN